MLSRATLSLNEPHVLLNPLQFPQDPRSLEGSLCAQVGTMEGRFIALMTAVTVRVWMSPWQASTPLLLAVGQPCVMLGFLRRTQLLWACLPVSAHSNSVHSHSRGLRLLHCTWVECLLGLVLWSPWQYSPLHYSCLCPLYKSQGAFGASGFGFSSKFAAAWI